MPSTASKTKRKNKCSRYIAKIRRQPKSFRKAVTAKAIRMLKANERSNILEMYHKGIITEEDMINLVRNIGN